MGEPNKKPKPSEEHPLVRKLREAPIDDEPLTDEERRLIDEAREAEEHGDVISHEQLKHDLGL